MPRHPCHQVGSKEPFPLAVTSLVPTAWRVPVFWAIIVPASSQQRPDRSELCVLVSHKAFLLWLLIFLPPWRYPSTPKFTLCIYLPHWLLLPPWFQKPPASIPKEWLLSLQGTIICFPKPIQVRETTPHSRFLWGMAGRKGTN